MKINYKTLLNIVGILIIVNILISALTDFWGISNYPAYINSVLGIFLILLAAQVYSRKKWFIVLNILRYLLDELY